MLAASAVLLAAGLCGLAFADRLPIYLAAWLVLGLGMGAGLYDAAFATLGRLYGLKARQAITALTLFGGLASTICWPLSAFLVSILGWRGTCLAYAIFQLGISLPLYLVLVPRTGRAVADPSACRQRHFGEPREPAARRQAAARAARRDDHPGLRALGDDLGPSADDPAATRHRLGRRDCTRALWWGRRRSALAASRC